MNATDVWLPLSTSFLKSLIDVITFNKNIYMTSYCFLKSKTLILHVMERLTNALLSLIFLSLKEERRLLPSYE